MKTGSKASKDVQQTSQKISSRLTRKIMQPPKRGTISRSRIRKVIREVISSRPISNEG